MLNKQISGIIFILIVTFLMACDIATPINNPPYVVTKPICEISERSGYFTYAGTVFKFMNTSGKTVNSITVTFMLFDARTRVNPFIGSNIFEITILGIISPLENKEILISLDQYIFVAPDEPYLIDFFFISEIRYTDGSIWQDRNGIYKIRG